MDNETAHDAQTLAMEGRYYLSAERRDMIRTILETTPADTWLVLQDRLGTIPGLSFSRDHNGEIWDMSRIGLFISLFGFLAFGPESTGVGPYSDAHGHGRILDLLEAYAVEKVGSYGDIYDPEFKWEDVPWTSDDCFQEGVYPLDVQLHMKLQFNTGRDADGLQLDANGWEWCRPEDMLFAINSLRAAHANWKAGYASAMESGITGCDIYLDAFATVMVDENLSRVHQLCTLLDRVQYSLPAVDTASFFDDEGICQTDGDFTIE
ncbi:hypothetical protein HYQ45_015145 [Verticillium longisporum]